MSAAIESYLEKSKAMMADEDVEFAVVCVQAAMIGLDESRARNRSQDYRSNAYSDDETSLKIEKWLTSKDGFGMYEKWFSWAAKSTVNRSVLRFDKWVRDRYAGNQGGESGTSDGPSDL